MIKSLLAILFALTLPLAGVSLAAEKPVRLPHAGITLNASLVTSASWPNGPMVLMTHGTLAHREMELISGLQGMLLDRGVSTLAINLSLGLDDRAASMYDCPTPHTHKHLDAVDEINAWLSWLRAQGAQDISLLGHSRGGNQTARFAAGHADAGIKTVFLLAPQTWSEKYVAKNYAKRYAVDLSDVLQQAGQRVAEGRGDELMGPMGFIYCENTQATAAAVVSYYTPDDDMDTPHVLPRIQAPVVVFAGSEDKVVARLIDKVTPMVDDDRISLVVVDGADHFFRDLYSEDIADAIAERLVEE